MRLAGTSLTAIIIGALLPIGKQLFQMDKSLWKSDALLADDEGAVEVDFSQYSREERHRDEEEEEIGVLYDSD